MNLATEIDEPQRPTAYDLLGGDARVRELVDRFYDLMDLEARFAVLRALHPESMDGSRDKLYWFLSGWMGGPNLYIEKLGHPMLRARHLPYAIASPERDQWLACMREAMQSLQIAPDLTERLMGAFFGTADWMRNSG
jgi:hemoglobin